MQKNKFFWCVFLLFVFAVKKKEKKTLALFYFTFVFGVSVFLLCKKTNINKKTPFWC